MLPVHYVLMGFVEYGMHRLVMHRSWSGYVFRGHHKEHHGQGINGPFQIDLPMWTNHLPVASPFLAFMLWRAIYVTPWAWGSLVALMIIFCWHSYTWTKLHRAFHDLEVNWTMSLWCYEELEQHHLDHHKRPGKNFGVLYLWVDRLFGTFWRSYETSTNES